MRLRPPRFLGWVMVVLVMLAGVPLLAPVSQAQWAGTLGISVSAWLAPPMASASPTPMPEPLAAGLSLVPGTLDTSSPGQYVYARVFLPPGSDSTQVDLTTLHLCTGVEPCASGGILPVSVTGALNASVQGASAGPTCSDPFCLDLTFNGSDVIGLTKGIALPADLTFTVSGVIAGQAFAGSDTISVLAAGGPLPATPSPSPEAPTPIVVPTDPALPRDTSTATPAPTATDTVTAIASDTVTDTPTAMPTATETPTPLPTATPTSGPSDLAPQSLTIVPEQPVEGLPLALSILVANRGQGEARGFWVAAYLDPAREPGPGGQGDVYWQMGVLSGGAVAQLDSSTAWGGPATLAPSAGKHKLWVRVNVAAPDGANAVNAAASSGLDESDGANNLLGPVEFEVLAPTATATGTATETVTATASATVTPAAGETPTDAATPPADTATATTAPSHTPVAEATVVPSDSPVPAATDTPTPEATSTHRPTHTPTEPAPAPTATPTLEPTATPAPTDTPTLAPVATETPTEAPAATPLPGDTPTVEPPTATTAVVATPGGSG